MFLFVRKKISNITDTGKHCWQIFNDSANIFLCVDIPKHFIAWYLVPDLAYFD